MAGGAQGGRPAQNQGVGTQGAPQVTPQAQQFQQALQNYRQGAVGMPSQVPGANMAAPGGGSIGMMPGETGRGGPMQIFNPGGGMASAAVMPQAPQMSQVMPQAQGSNMAGAAVMPQVGQAQLQQIQAMANNPAYQQALLAAQQATMGGGNAAPTPMPMPRPTPQAQGQQTAMPMDARILPNGATVGRDDPRFYQGMGQQAPAVMPRPTPVPQAQPMPRPTPAPQGGFDLSSGAPVNREQAINAFMQGARERQNMARPQIQGNPNSMPMQRGQGRVR